MMLNTNNRKDISGKRNGRLVAIKPIGIAGDGHIKWLCKCDCGNTKEISVNMFRDTGGTRSCGCLRSDAAKKRIKKDGVWNDGKSYSINSGKRCYKTRHAWAKAVIRENGNRCAKCGWKKGRCDVHHKKLKSKGGLHTIANGIVLCPNCHRIEHDKKR